MSSAGATQRDSKMGFELRGIPWQQVRYQVQKPSRPPLRPPRNLPSHCRPRRSSPERDRSDSSKNGLGRNRTSKTRLAVARHTLKIRKTLDLDRQWRLIGPFDPPSASDLPPEIVGREVRRVENEIREIADIRLESTISPRRSLFQSCRSRSGWGLRATEKRAEKNLRRGFHEDQPKYR